MARSLKSSFRQMQSGAEHTGLSVGYQEEQGFVGSGDESALVSRRGGVGRQRGGEPRVFPFPSQDGEAPHVGDMPMRRIPVIAAHMSMAAARRVAALRRIALLLVETEEQIAGIVDQSILGAADDQTPVVRAMKPLGLHLRPAMSVAEARETFVRARTSVLPVIAGGFVLGAVERAVIERIKPPR